MRGMPDASVDAVITDPPYGIRYCSNYYKDGNPFGEMANDDKYPANLIAEFKRVARKAVLSFCRWEALFTVPPPTSFIAWIKNNWTAGDLLHAYGRMWEGILFYALKEHGFDTRPPDVFQCNRVPHNQLLHPTQKPVALMEWLISRNTKPNDTVLDPFMGSGTTGVACVKLNRNFIGVEINPVYFAIAQKRIAEARAQLHLPPEENVAN
jgi:site-specific DNA-methyltransferase (adenine-specific)